MFDRQALAILRPAVTAMGAALAQRGLRANQLTVAGLLLGLGAAVCIALQSFGSGAVLILLSRMCDALDGAVARQSQPTDAGAFLDIAFDFLFYASVPLAFAIAAPQQNALPAAALLAGFIGTGSSFLAFSALAAKRKLQSTAYPDKSIYYLGGLTEATETIAVFLAMCVWPQHFALWAYGFAALCALTTCTRVLWGWRAFQ